MNNMTKITLEYLYCYYSRTFSIDYDGQFLIVTKPDGTIIEQIDCGNVREVVRDVFYDLKKRFILDYDNELR